MTLLANIRFRLKLARNLRARKAARPILTERAMRGQATRWSNAGRNCLFAEMGG